MQRARHVIGCHFTQETRLHNACRYRGKQRSPGRHSWAVVFTSAVAVCAVETIADEVQQTLVRMRYARAELMASVAGVTAGLDG